MFKPERRTPCSHYVQSSKLFTQFFSSLFSNTGVSAEKVNIQAGSGRLFTESYKQVRARHPFRKGFFLDSAEPYNRHSIGITKKSLPVDSAHISIILKHNDMVNIGSDYDTFMTLPCSSQYLGYS